MLSGPAIIGKTPAEFQVFLDEPFWRGVAWDCLKLVDEPRLKIIASVICEFRDCEELATTSGLVFALADHGSHERMPFVFLTACSGRNRDWKNIKNQDFWNMRQKLIINNSTFLSSTYLYETIFEICLSKGASKSKLVRNSRFLQSQKLKTVTMWTYKVLSKERRCMNCHVVRSNL